MSTPDGRDVMLKRHEIVVRIIDVNSRILRIDNEINGLDIERRNAERDVHAVPSSGRGEALFTIEERISELGAMRQKILTEKAWLEQTLDDFDSAAAANETSEKRSVRRMS
ncbi:hypothetical protein [Hyphomicrobium sp.]|uniref:hypothetical protein n=1 Tax=Hyphomicrobium sp. TaxID=82 RepID=UPI000F98D7D4|nr:hypothetical protein [Hyphomicrobium sp.]RUP08814.1 MAG: hypothetical protein EKK38_13835 [Hyphomicrobium sp.]